MRIINFLYNITTITPFKKSIRVFDSFDIICIKKQYKYKLVPYNVILRLM